MTDFSTLLFKVEDGIATVTLNRPERMNAFNAQMMRDIVAALDHTDASDDVKAVIFTGQGDRAYCAGADLSAGQNTFNFDRQDAEDRAPQGAGGEDRDGGGIVTLRLFDSLKPIIGAINGAAVGVGATMLLAMDFRLAAASARFGFVFNRRGLAPESASAWFLPRLVGMPTALEWCYSGRLFGAEEAQAKGLVQSVHVREDLLPAARAFARELVGNSAPVSVALTRQLLWRMWGTAHPMEAHRHDSRAIYRRGAQADAREGIAAFLEKRVPNFTDKVATDMPDIWDGWVAPDYDQ